MSETRHRVIPSGWGAFLLIRDGDGTIRTGWAGFGSERSEVGRPDPRLLPDLAARLRAYFEGSPVRFEDVPIAAGTPFQRSCWRAARSIPRGRSHTYAELAAAAGSPRAFRAAGQAMRRNPQPIITPCHRIVGSAGGLGGFAGATAGDSEAIRTKRRLLALEGAPAV